MKKRKFSKNPNCPLTKEEKSKLSILLNQIEWREYQPVRHITGGYAEVRVIDYDEIEVHIEIKWGVDGYHHETETETIQREEILSFN